MPSNTAAQLPANPQCHILDLGCGMGLELDYYFQRNPQASVTGVDLAEGMLRKMKSKFPGKDLTLLHSSYFTIPMGENRFDAAVSVESLHHFSQESFPLSKFARIVKGEWLFYTDGLYGENRGGRKGEFPESPSVKKRREHYRSSGLSF